MCFKHLLDERLSMHISTNPYMYRFSILLSSETNLPTRKCHLTRSFHYLAFQEKPSFFGFHYDFQLTLYLPVYCQHCCTLYQRIDLRLIRHIYTYICIVLHVMIIFTISNVLWVANKIFCVLQLFIYTFTNDRYSGRIKAKILFRMQFI